MDIIIKNQHGEEVIVGAGSFKDFCEEKGWHYESAIKVMNRPTITYKLHTLRVYEPDDKPSPPVKPRKKKTTKSE